MGRQDGYEAGGGHRPDGEEVRGTDRRGESLDPEELMARLGIKDNRIRELYEEITAFRLAADEARASKEAGEEHIEALERECANLRERVRDLEEATRDRRRRRERRPPDSATGARTRTQGRGDLTPRLPAGAPDRTDGGRQAAGRGTGLAQGPRAPGRSRRVDGLERDLEERRRSPTCTRPSRR